jgi:hypothetical protein
MVKVSFIVEGDVEKILVDALGSWFKEKGIMKVGPVINVRGGGNLCPNNLNVYIDQAKVYHPQKILILTDLECDTCVTQTKKRVGDCDECVVIVARKAIEAWFLADTVLLENLFKGRVERIEEPEKTDSMPFDILRQLLIERTGRGVSKKMLARQSVKYFSPERAASHPNCQSVAYFVRKIEEIAQLNV